MTDEEAIAEQYPHSSDHQPKTDPQVAALEQEDKDWLEAFRAKAISADELRAYRDEIASRLRAPRTPVRRDVPLGRYRELAENTDLGAMLRNSGAKITVTPEEVRVSLF